MKYEIVQLLKEAVPGYVSGGELGRRFCISRTAIWKYMEELRQEGYSIEASSRKGYRLLPTEDRLNSYEIARDLGTMIVGQEVQFFDTLESTNDYAKRLAAEGCVDGMSVIAGQQTLGRGRLGRKWLSPPDKGIYTTVVLRPDMAPAQTQIFTLAAAVAAVKAISRAVGIRLGIKWPNDLVFDGKKVCGILVEMSSEADRVNHIVIGIGINYSQSAEEFPSELSNRAISLEMAVRGMDTSSEVQETGETMKTGECKTSYSGTEASETATYGSISRLSVIRSFLREMDEAYRLVIDGRQDEILDLWREYSVTIGKEVRFILRDVEHIGTAVDITPDGRLTVDCSDGILRELYSGEVSVRGIYGYV